MINHSIRSVLRTMWPRKRPSRHAGRSRGATRFIPRGILSRKTVLREYLRTEHQNLPRGWEEKREWGVISRYIPVVCAAGTTTNVSRYSREIELQLARFSLGRFCRGVTRNMLVPPSTIWSRRWDSIVNLVVSARPAGWLTGWLGWLVWLAGCETMTRCR